MNRKTFFKRLFGAAAVATIAPRILAEEKEETFQDIIDADQVSGNTWGVFTSMPATGCVEFNPNDWAGLTTQNHLQHDIMRVKLEQRYQGYSLADFLEELKQLRT